MHRFPIHLTFDGDTDDDDTDDDDTPDDDNPDDDDPDDQPYWDMLDFITIGGIPDIIRTDKIPFGGNDNHEYDLEAYSHHDKIPWSHHDVFDGDDKENQTVPVYLDTFQSFY